MVNIKYESNIKLEKVSDDTRSLYFVKLMVTSHLLKIFADMAFDHNSVSYLTV